MDINFGTVKSFSFQKPRPKLERFCIITLKGVGAKNPQLVYRKLWDREYDHCLPPKSLLIVVGDLCRSRGTAPCGGRVSLRRKKMGGVGSGVLHGV